MSPVIYLMSFLQVGTRLKLMRFEKISVAGNLFECLEGEGAVNKTTLEKLLFNILLINHLLSIAFDSRVTLDQETCSTYGIYNQKVFFVSNQM